MFLTQSRNRRSLGFLLSLFFCALGGSTSAQEPAEKAAQIKLLLKDRCDLAKKLLTAAPERYKVGSIHFATVAQIERDALRAIWELGDSPERLAALKQYQKATEEICKCVEDRAHVGIANRSQANLAKVLMLEARLAVLAQTKESSSNEIKNSLKERYELLHQIFDAMPGQYKAGNVHLATVVQIGDTVRSNLVLDVDSEERFAALKKYENAAEQMAKDTDIRYQTGLTNCLDRNLTKVLLLEAQLAVLAQTKRPAQSLLKERRDLLARSFTLLLDRYKAGTASITQVLHAERDVLKANLDLDMDSAERMSDLRKGLETAEATLKLTDSRFKLGVANAMEVDQVRAALLDIRIDLLREERKAKP